MKHITLLLMNLAIFSIQALAEIRTCEALDSDTQPENMFQSRETWYEIKQSNPKQYAILRSQAEAIATIYLDFYKYPDWLPKPEELKSLSDLDLDTFGEGIYFGRFFGYNYVQFGFGGGNSITMLFKPDSNQLGTRIYSWDGVCDIYKGDLACTAHLPPVSYYD